MAQPSKLKVEPLSTIVYEIIKEFDFSSAQTNEVMALLQSETGKYVQSSSHRIIKNRNWLIISPNASPFELDKHPRRTEMLKQRAQENNLTFIYVNQIGGQDEFVFDGGSLVVNSSQGGGSKDTWVLSNDMSSQSQSQSQTSPVIRAPSGEFAPLPVIMTSAPPS